MGFFKDILISIPFGIILNIFVHQMANTMNNDLQYNDKFQRSLIIIFVSGIISLLIGNTIFKTNKSIKNSVMQYGLTIGGLLMIVYTTISNWDNMDDTTKLIIFGLLLGGIIFYIYKWYNKSDKKEKKKVNKLIEKLKEENDDL
jgi:hypothetical protein